MGFGRAIGIAAGTVVILAVGLYGPATLLAPLPHAEMTATKVERDSNGTPPVLPEAGASALTESADGPVMVTAGDSEQLPMAGIAKVLTALVVLDEKPMDADEDGELVPITSEDFLIYNDYRDAGTRVVTVYTDDTWTQRDVLQAMLQGSSNNHADTLAAWAFGSVDEYVASANDWLAEHDLSETSVVDATGLSPDDVSTASDLARLAALAMDNPVIPSILDDPVDGIAEERGVENTTQYMEDRGVTGISRSYTDAAGICLLFAATITVDDASYTFYGSMIRLPDWDSLDSAMSALMDSAEAGVTSGQVLEPGTVVAEFSTPWGEQSQGVIGSSTPSVRWVAAAPKVSVSSDEFSVGAAGDIVGRASVSEGASVTDIPVKLDQSIYAPDVFWRLTHPLELIPLMWDQLLGH